MAELSTRKRAIETSPRRRMNSGGLRAKAWWVIRNRKKITLEALLSRVSAGAQKDPESNIRKYFSALVKAGILKVEEKRQPGKALTSNGHYCYCLVVDCGIEAPLYRVKLKQIYAPSTGNIYPLEVKNDE